MTETKKAVKTIKKAKKINTDKFAVIKISGAQLKVSEGTEYEVKKLEGNKGDKIEITEVLLVSDGENTTIGTPYIADTKVVLEITSQGKGEKINGFKFKSKSRTRRHFGSRELLTKVLVKKI